MEKARVDLKGYVRVKTSGLAPYALFIFLEGRKPFVWYSDWCYYCNRPTLSHNHLYQIPVGLHWQDILKFLKTQGIQKASAYGINGMVICSDCMKDEDAGTS